MLMHCCRRILGAIFLLVLFRAAGVVADTGLALDYPPPVKTILEQRCVVCHGCYDAPCQLKMDAWAGMQRGANKDKVYDGTRLLSANLTRLWEDAHSIEEWRKKGFYPVVSGSTDTAGTLQKMLSLKEEFPLQASGPLPDDFDFSLDRNQSCPKPDEFAEYREERPYQGMPYGFPGLDSQRLAVLNNWLNDGAPGVEPSPRPNAELRAVVEWEAFLNGEDNKTRLMSRYIYEHLFIGDVYFEDIQLVNANTQRGWYKLVRSRSPPGQPIDLIATRRPYDDPGTESFYYRFQLRYDSRLAKRHMPYALGSTRMARWRSLFLEPDYRVASLPDYRGAASANPFITFEQLPVEARYRFMLDEAHFTIMAYIKGPVCRGQVALNVIDDHFWVAFVEPNSFDPSQQAAFLAREAHHMRLPQAGGGLLVSALQWRGYAKSQQRFIQARARAIAKSVDQDKLDIDVDLIWDGGSERNDNAALTIFRHFDSATVVKGLVGQQPDTMWIIDYSLLERIHYLLVAGFDVYGAVSHQLESRLYMDFLRMEGELTFLLFLPKKDRLPLRNHWYRGATERVREYLLSSENAEYQRDTAINFQTDQTKKEFMSMLQAHIPAASAPHYAVAQEKLAALMSGPSGAFSHLPEVAFLQLLAPDGGREAYTLIHNRAHSNNAQLFGEENRLLPFEDTLTVTRGFIGAYPNMFFQLTEAQLGKFIAQLRMLASSEDYTRLVERYGVRRTAPWFWKLSDEFNQAYRKSFPIEAGLFDLNRYENR